MPMSPAKFMELLESIPALQAAVLKHAAAHDAGTAINFTGNARVAYNKALAEAAPAAGYPSVAAFKADLDPVARQTFPELAEAPFWQSLFGVKGHGKPGVPGMNAAESKRAKAAIAAEDAFIGAKDPLTGQRRGGAIEKPSVDRQVFGEAEGTAESQGAVRSAREAADEALRPQYTRKNKKGEDVTKRHNVKKEFNLAAASELRKEGLVSEEAASQVNGMPLGRRNRMAQNTKITHEDLGADDLGTFAKEREVQQAIIGEPSEKAIDMIRRGADVPSSRYANDDRIIEALLGKNPRKSTVAADKAAFVDTPSRNVPGVGGKTIAAADTPDAARGMARKAELEGLGAEPKSSFTPADDILQELAPSPQGRYYERPLNMSELPQRTPDASSMAKQVEPGVYQYPEGPSRFTGQYQDELFGQRTPYRGDPIPEGVPARQLDPDAPGQMSLFDAPQEYLQPVSNYGPREFPVGPRSPVPARSEFLADEPAEYLIDRSPWMPGPDARKPLQSRGQYDIRDEFQQNELDALLQQLMSAK